MCPARRSGHALHHSAAAKRRVLSGSGEARTLPEAVRTLAERLGARTGTSSVTLTQTGTMRQDAQSRSMRFSARQTINLLRCEFHWRATTGPFGCISVVDSLKDDQPELQVRLFRYLRLAAAPAGAELAKGEIMRYLAELALAPDAILNNPSLTWVVGDRATIRVSASCDGTRGEVELQLDEQGRIGAISASDRPRQQGSVFVEHPWRGRFFDYRQHLGRWLPFGGEVGWVLDGETTIVWRGRIESWSIR